MVSKRVSDDVFFRGLRAYSNAHREANARTEDLRFSLEKASGKALKNFFAGWVYGRGHPQYQLQWSSKNVQNAVLLTVTLEQTQAGEPFLDPVPIEFTVNGKKQQQTI